MKLCWITCTDDVVLDAVTAVLACVPRPWTRRMTADAVDAVLSVADRWRGPMDEREVDLDDLHTTYLEERLGPCRKDALLGNIVAE
jgi:hypothetical protein